MSHTPIDFGAHEWVIAPEDGRLVVRRVKAGEYETLHRWTLEGALDRARNTGCPVIVFSD